MSITEPLTVLKNELVQKIVPEVVELLASALQEGTPAHKVEENLWGNRSPSKTGAAAHGQFL